MVKSKNEVQKEYDKRTNYAAQNKYIKEKTKIIPIRVMFNTDEDIISRLDSLNNKTGYIKELIRNDTTIFEKYQK